MTEKILGETNLVENWRDECVGGCCSHRLETGWRVETGVGDWGGAGKLVSVSPQLHASLSVQLLVYRVSHLTKLNKKEINAEVQQAEEQQKIFSSRSIAF